MSRSCRRCTPCSRRSWCRSADFPVSAQTGEPVAQVVAPVLQTLAGWQLVPAAHMTQVPALQTRSVPQVTPFANDWPVSVQPIVGEQTVTPA